MYQKKEYISYGMTTIDLLKDLYEQLILISKELKVMGYSSDAFTISKDAEKLNVHIEEVINNLKPLEIE